MSCDKTRYPTRARAERALQQIRKLGERTNKKPTRSYPCPMCNGWHLTSEAR